jgi:HD-GYP domain-containing protein (c-di-GMP phosphodiesterase class II)
VPSVAPLLLVPTGAPIGLVSDEIEVRVVTAFPAAASLDPDRPTVILVDRALLSTLDGDLDRMRDTARLVAVVGLGGPLDREPPADFPAELLTSFLPGDAPPGLVRTQLLGAFRHATALRAGYRELTEMTRIGAALSTERSLIALLEMILTQARRISQSDAGSIYLADRGDEGTPAALRFKLAQNSSLPDLPLPEYTVPVDHSSIAGYAAVTGQPLVIADVYQLSDSVAYRWNRSFDERFGYRTKSMLVIPMKTHRDEVVGVLQLINRKVDGEVRPYDQRSVELVSALASQAAVAIENSLLYADIERLFEGFVTAAVTAIEARDPTTHGHSARVAAMSVALATAVDRGGGQGRHRGLRFSAEQLRELRYAGLLHDFGKVGVREQVLIKQKKLYPRHLDIIRLRFATLAQAAKGADERAQLGRFFQAVIAANEPELVPDQTFDELRQLRGITFPDLDGEQRELLTSDEYRWLTIPRGTLDEAERREIESHVTHTFRFLRQIPWTRELRRVPEIAFAHHEKLNGRGYPRAISGDAIPVESRIMTIADIYDALTAADRPYKRAVSVERALDILSTEVRDGQLDADLLATFIAARIWENEAS